MKSIVVASLIALAFTTGFTCSKNQPTTEAQPAATPTQEQMAAPAAPAENNGAPADGAAAAPAAPAETAPATPPADHK
jgi:hypothetical protein